MPPCPLRGFRREHLSCLFPILIYLSLVALGQMQNSSLGAFRGSSNPNIKIGSSITNDDPMPDRCVFCRIANKSAPSHIIAEDDKHIAFLDIAPLVEGQAVVIPKKHYPSYHFNMSDDAL